MGTKQSIAIGLLGLGFGATLGVGVAVSVDPTSYAQSDLDKASAAAPPSAPLVTDAVDPTIALQEKLRVANARITQLASLGTTQDKQLGRADREVVALEKKVKELSKRPTAADLTALRSSLQGRIQDQQAAVEKTAATSFTGSVRAAMTYTAKQEPWPTDCASAKSSFQVRVNTADGALVTIAPMTDFALASRVERPDGTLAMTCLLTYQAEVPGPVDDSYELQAISLSSPGSPLKTAEVKGSDLEAGSVPELFAPERS